MEILNVTEQIINVNASEDVIDINVVEEVININVDDATINIVTQPGAYPLPSTLFSVFGRVGNVVAQAGDYSTSLVTEGTNLYYTNARSRAAISETITGINYDNASGIFSMASGYSIPTDANQTNWTAAYNDKINSASVTGTTTKTLTLNQQDGGTITASWTDENTGGVTSVFGRTGVVIAANGDYNTSQVTENTNLYFTNARSRSAISETITGIDYDNTSGVFSLASGYVIPTQASLDAKQDDLNGTGIVKSTAGTITYLTDNTANWDAAYNDKINSASVTGTTTKTLTLNQQDGGTITASWTDDNTDAVTSVFGRTGVVVATEGDYTLTQLGDVTLTSPASGQVLKYNGTAWINGTDTDTGLTSVGLSMPSAFSVSGSPLTSNGTISVTGAGSASQYVRGDGSLANFPTSTGGGSSVAYYFNSSVSQGTLGGVAYRELNKVPVIGSGTDISIAADGYIASYITDAGDPALLEIPAGNWNFEMYFSSSSSGGTPSFYVELYKYNGTTFTLISSSSATPEGITNGTAIDIYTTALSVPSTILTLTDRLAIRVYVTHSGKTITLHTENSHLCEVITTFSSGISALNGLTNQVQYLATGTTGTDFNISSATDTHTFNLPTASGTNTGKLSSSDWTIFNNKLSTATAASTYVPYTGATTNVNLGANDLTSNAIYSKNIVATSNGLSSGNFLIQQSTGSSDPSVGYSLISSSGNFFDFKTTVGSGANVKKSRFDLSGLTSFTTRTYTLPDADGTLALTTDLSSYVTLTGTQTISGLKTFTALATNNEAIGIKLTTGVVSTGGYLTLNSKVVGTLHSLILAPDSTTNRAEFSFDNTALRTYTLPDASGTIALTSNLSSYLPLSGGTLTGALSGTSATFSSSVTASSLIKSGGTSSQFLKADGSVDSTAYAAALSGTINTIAYWDSATTIASLTLATYPSLTELSYVKGVTSAIQTQLNGKQGTLTLTTTGTSGAATLVGDTLNIPQYSGGGGGSISLAAIGSTPNANAATLTGTVLNLEPASASFGGVVTTGTQTFAGAKTFASTIEANSLSGASSLIQQWSYNGGAAAYNLKLNTVVTSGNVRYSFDLRNNSTDYLNNLVLEKGWVGIGTNSVQNALDVVRGTAGAMGRGTYETAAFSYNADMKVGVYTSSGTASDGASLLFGQTNLQAASTYPAMELQYQYSSTVANNHIRINYVGRNASGLNTTATANLFVVSQGGRVGVNLAQASIGSNFQVNGNAAIGYSASTAAPTNGLAVSGNVGIGTNSPDAIFHVAKATTGGLGGQVVIDNPAGSSLGNNVEISFLTDGGASGTATRNGRIRVVNENQPLGSSNMQFWTWNGSTDAERMRITSGGDIGIGTTTIGSKLQVNGNAAIGYSASTAAPTNGLAVSGNLTIGTTTANGSLQVSGASGTGFLTAQRLDNTTNSAYQSWSFGGSSAGGISGFVNANILEAVPFSTGNFVISAFSNNIVFMTNNRNERMRITSAGSVGILTSTIGSSLQINGNAAIGYNASTAAPTNGLAVAGIVNTASRVNVNGAGDNSLFSLNNNGTTYTVGFSPTATASSATTLTITSAATTWIYNGIGAATWTLPNPSGTNQMFWFKNAGTGIITLNAFAGTNIIDNTATPVTSITIAVGATAVIQQDGNVRSYQLQ